MIKEYALEICIFSILGMMFITLSVLMAIQEQHTYTYKILSDNPIECRLYESETSDR